MALTITYATATKTADSIALIDYPLPKLFPAAKRDSPNAASQLTPVGAALSEMVNIRRSVATVAEASEMEYRSTESTSDDFQLISNINLAPNDLACSNFKYLVYFETDACNPEGRQLMPHSNNAQVLAKCNYIDRKKHSKGMNAR